MRYRYGLRRQLLLNLGLVVLVVWGLLSLVLTRTAYLRFMQERVRYLNALSEQIEQVVLLKYGQDTRASRRLWLGRDLFREDTLFWPSHGLVVMKGNRVVPIFGAHSVAAVLRVRLWEKENKPFELVWRQKEGRNVWERYKVLYVRGKKIGVLWLSWDITKMRGEFFSYQGLLFLSLLLFGCLILFLSLSFLERRLLMPLDRLGDAMASLSLGEREEGLSKELGRRDEIGDLARAFVEMEDVLSRQTLERETHISELAEANDALERAQEELVQREKMATVGHLAAGVAHEVGNPLSAIIGYSDLLKGTKEWSELEADLVVRIHKEAHRIDRIIRDLLDYSRPMTRIDPGNVAQAVEESLELLRLQPRFKQMSVEKEIDASLPLVRLSENSLVQVLINFLLNAADACEGKGVVKIQTEHVEDEVILHLSDDGPGIVDEVQSRLFEPFFTTKAPGKGIGLGLALCQRLVTESGGKIEVVPFVEGEGAHFKLRLAVAKEEDASLEAHSDASGSPVLSEGPDVAD